MVDPVAVAEDVAEVGDQVEVRGEPEPEGGEQVLVALGGRHDHPEQRQEEVHQEGQQHDGGQGARAGLPAFLVYFLLPLFWVIVSATITPASFAWRGA